MLKKEPLQMSDRQKLIITKIVKQGRVGTRLCNRLKVLLLASEGRSDYEINKVVGLHKGQIKKWRDRWEQKVESIVRLEQNSAYELTDRALRNHILKIVSDLPRPGKPSRISLDQKNQIIAIVCEKPKDHGVPISKWTLSALTDVVKEEKIVENISRSYLAKILQKKTSTTKNEKLDVSQN